MTYQHLQRNLSAMITQAGPQVQRRLTRAFAELVVERSPLPRTDEALAAVSAGGYGESELRQWMRDRAEAEYQRCLRLQYDKDNAEETRQPWTQETELVAAYQTKSVYRMLAAVLDEDPHRSAQKTAYLARFATSDQEAETVVGLILREAGFDVSYDVYWIYE